MQYDSESVLGFAAALGIGLLIGIERERSKGSGPERGPGGVRTFALFAMAGAAARLLNEAWTVPVVLAAAAALAVASYLRSSSRDPGLTTEVALVLTTLLGMLAIGQPALAAGLGVVTAVILAARTRLHQLATDKLSGPEIHDALVLAAAALVVLPLLPDRAIDPTDTLNPRVIWSLAVLVMSINAVGYIALRTLGPIHGLALSGFAGGFVSSTATHGAMAGRAAQDPTLTRAALAGAALSSVSTPLYMLMVLALVSPALMSSLGLAMGLSAAAASMVGAGVMIAAGRAPHGEMHLGRPFDLRQALIFTATFSLVMLIAALLEKGFGSAGALWGVALAGLADTQAAGASAGAMLEAGRLPLLDARTAVMLAYTVNGVMKVLVSVTAGGVRFAGWIAGMQVAMVSFGWLGWAWS
ncbi:MAG: MgtC/SapB family protein [Steroidobacteraceae bacterium]